MTDSGMCESYRDALIGVRTFGLNLGYGIRREPLRDYSQIQVRPSKRPVVLEQWLIDHGALTDTVLSAFADLKPGVTRQIMCGTSAGKTTMLPVKLAKSRESAVIVLAPSLGVAAHVVAYVRDTVAVKEALTGGVHLLDDATLQKPAAGACVYFCSVGEFLGLFSRNLGMLQRLNVSTIIVDESHVVRPEYVVFRYLVAANFFASVIVLYATATAASDISMESKGKRTVSKYAHFPMAPDDSRTDMPYHFSHILGKTMIFCSDAGEIELWATYYREHDIPCYAVGYELRTAHEAEIKQFLKTNDTCVFLTTSLHETSYTYDVDVVIDFGYTTEISTDFSTGEVVVSKRVETMSEQVQRAGRVGRFKKGVAWVPQRPFSEPRGEDDPNICQYVYLWSKVFGITINHSPVSDFAAVFGNCSSAVVALLLTSGLPPFCLLPYLSVDGLYPPFFESYRVFSACQGTIVKSTSNNCDTKLWEERVAHHPSLPQGCATYKSRFCPHPKFAMFHYHMWAKYSKLSDVETIRSFALSDFSPGRSKHVSFNSVNSYKAGRIASVVSTESTSESDFTSDYESSVVSEEVPRLIPPPTYAKSVPLPIRRPVEVSNVARVPEVNVGKPQPFRAQDAPVVNETPNRIQEWTKHVQTSAPSSSGSSSGMDVDMSLKQVDPEKHIKQFMYPMDYELRRKFVRSHAVNARDLDRTKQCVSGKINFSQLSVDSTALFDKQASYFLSFLRVHRHLLIKLMQLRAAPEPKPSMFAIGRERSKIDSTNDKLGSVGALLAMCTNIKFVVGIERVKLHSSWSAAPSTERGVISEAQHDRLSSEAALGSTAVALSAPVVAETVSELKSAAMPVVDSSGEFVANGWYFNGLTLTSAHVWEEMSDEMRREWTQLHEFKVQTVDDTVGIVSETLGASLLVRRPVHGEYVGVYSVAYSNGKPKMYGHHQIDATTSPVLLNTVYYPGMSGSLLIAYSDGAIVGMYCGVYMHYRGVWYGRVSPIVFDYT